MASIDGHQAISLGVNGRVETEGQTHPPKAETCEGSKTFGNPGRTHGDLLLPEGETAGIGQHAERRHEMLRVIQGLPHPHEDQIVDPPAQHRARDHHLSDDLLRSQISEQTKAPRFAEPTAQSASHLTRETQGAAPFGHRDPHTLDLEPVMSAKSHLARLPYVDGVLACLVHSARRDRKIEMKSVAPSLDRRRRHAQLLRSEAALEGGPIDLSPNSVSRPYPLARVPREGVARETEDGERASRGGDGGHGLRVTEAWRSDKRPRGDASFPRTWQRSSVRAPRALVLIPFLAGCPSQSSVPPANETALRPGARVTPVRLGDSEALIGTSGLDVRGGSEVWLAPERTGHLVTLALEGAALMQTRRRPIDGIPKGADVEALALVPGAETRVLLGTEAKGSRAQDPILVATVEEERVHVTGALVFDYAPFGVVAANNQGIEGLCAGEGFAVAASEAIVEAAGRRFACVGRFDLPNGMMRPYRVGLASQRGKLSALTCRAHEDGVEVHAIERHFGTMRLVRFVLGTEPEVSAALVTDLAPALGPEPPNVEGLAWLDDTRLLLVSDNHYRVKTGPTLAFIVEL